VTLLYALVTSAHAVLPDGLRDPARAAHLFGRSARRPSESRVSKGQAARARLRVACGYWHWDAVRYIWVDGRWQAP